MLGKPSLKRQITTPKFNLFLAVGFPTHPTYSFMEGLVLKTSKKEKVLTEDNNQLFFEALSFCSLSFILSILWSIYFHPTFRPSLLPIHKTMELF